jgi:p-hydroxybenzoate 3-monooxygenase
MLSRALEGFYKTNTSERLENYSKACLKRVWNAQRFSWWMTRLMHRFPDESRFDRRRQLSDLQYITSSDAAMTSLAEQYVGLPFD